MTLDAAHPGAGLLLAAAIRLAGVWKLAAVNDTISRLATGDKNNASLRQAAIDALVARRNEEIVRHLARLRADSARASARSGEAE